MSRSPYRPTMAEVLCSPDGMGWLHAVNSVLVKHGLAIRVKGDREHIGDQVYIRTETLAPGPGSTIKLTKAQERALRKAATEGWHPYGGPEHRVALRLHALDLYRSNTGRPTPEGSAWLVQRDAEKE